MSVKGQVYARAAMPRFPGWWAALGPGIIWMALAQGSAELIWWPYLIAKYGLAFLFLLIPACLLQYPVNYEIGMYTLLTGEGIFQGFIRLSRPFAFLLWILMSLSFLWFGAFASAGGTALAALTQFPNGWDARAQTLFWAYASMGVFLLGLVFSRVVYELIERFMLAIAVITVAGLVWACAQPEVIQNLGAFVKGIVHPQLPPPRPWDPADAEKLLTGITFAGLGGFWTLFYSYWLREKGAGMAAHMGHITSPITGKKEFIPQAGFVFEDSQEARRNLGKWKRFLLVDSSVGIGGNILTTLMACLLAFSLLYPKGILPEKYEIAVVQSRFFEVGWGVAGRILFLLVAAAFLSDTWLATIDAVARIQTDCVTGFFGWARRWEVRTWYYVWIAILAVVTGVTILFAEPGPLILLSAVIGFAGTVLFSAALILLNHRYLKKHTPPGTRAGRLSLAGISFSAACYLALAVVYLVQKFTSAR